MLDVHYHVIELPADEIRLFFEPDEKRPPYYAVLTNDAEGRGWMFHIKPGSPIYEVINEGVAADKLDRGRVKKMLLPLLDNNTDGRVKFMRSNVTDEAAIKAFMEFGDR